MKFFGIVLIAVFIFCETVLISLAVRSFLYPLKYEQYILQYSRECNLSPSLVASIINVESGFKTLAKSNAGAMGLMQIMPDTASYISQIKDLDYQEKDDLFTPEKNIKIGCYYLQYLTQKFDNIDTALCAYNAGETVVRNWLNNPKYSQDKITLENIPYKETKNYLIKINKNIKIYKKYKIN